MKPTLLRLPPSFREKPWGSRNLSPLFPPHQATIGEVWFEAEEPLPLLIKFLFTEKALSVQVHPDDLYAAHHENSRGKTEMWYVLRAEPGAKVGVGFKEPISKSTLRDASLSGEIEKLLAWIDVSAGDVVFTPAGTVHAIGAGLALCEIQQHSDVTYRLYDYGSGRELHLDKAVAVSDCGCHPGKHLPRGNMLVECDHFVTELLPVAGELRYQPHAERDQVLIAIEGQGSIGGESFCAGDVFLAKAGGSSFSLDGAARFLRTWAP